MRLKNDGKYIDWHEKEMVGKMHKMIKQCLFQIDALGMRLKNDGKYIDWHEKEMVGKMHKMIKQ